MRTRCSGCCRRARPVLAPPRRLDHVGRQRSDAMRGRTRHRPARRRLRLGAERSDRSLRPRLPTPAGENKPGLASTTRGSCALARARRRRRCATATSARRMCNEKAHSLSTCPSPAPSSPSSCSTACAGQPLGALAPFERSLHERNSTPTSNAAARSLVSADAPGAVGHHRGHCGEPCGGPACCTKVAGLREKAVAAYPTPIRRSWCSRPRCASWTRRSTSVTRWCANSVSTVRGNTVRTASTLSAITVRRRRPSWTWRRAQRHRPPRRGDLAAPATTATSGLAGGVEVAALGGERLDVAASLLPVPAKVRFGVGLQRLAPCSRAPRCCCPTWR